MEGSVVHTSKLRPVSLSDRFDLTTKESVFLTGNQAILRLVLMQRERDRRAGLSTAGYVSGYRGSPVGGLDLTFWKEESLLRSSDIIFEPGINEDLAATALWGTQQAEMRGEGRYDGVFGVWYGKGPGVDRSGDVFRHANLAGTSKNGGVLVLMGDDHTAESSTTAHQSEFCLLDLGLPILSPAGVQELLDYGVIGYGLSRYAGVWVGLKCVKDTIESTAIVDGRVNRVSLVDPKRDVRPEGGLNIRVSDPILAQEARLHESKRDAIISYVESNKLNRIVLRGGKSPRIGVITAGKSYLDVRQALDDLGLDEVRANKLGLRLMKIGCVWPLSRREVRSFARGLDLIIVVEEKRGLLEVQVREELYGVPDEPVIVGKKDEKNKWLFPIKGALDSTRIAVEIGVRLNRYARDEALSSRVNHLKNLVKIAERTDSVSQRVPYFCAGCPHNTSTRVPDGSRAYAGIGCHYMVQWMDRSTEGYTHMGGEGANWIGEHHFSTRDHVYQNLGDGTYNHSGLMAVRAAAASGANITYKILFNDAVAMTGGQPNEGDLTPWDIANQVFGVGAKRVVVVSDDPSKYEATINWPHGTTIHHRDELDSVQRDLSSISGLTVMIYDQTCASEKRRRRKRGLYPDPDERIYINDRVCEGCGDCGLVSNCVAIDAVDTDYGRKRRIDQSSCNKDYSCVGGFCPSFVSVHGGRLRRAERAVGVLVSPPSVPAPDIPVLDCPYGVIVTGVGGTGVVTIGAIMGMAAHLEGKGGALIDMAGLAQKGGEVTSHLRLAPSPDDINSIRISTSADLVLACDMVTASTSKVLGAVESGRTRLVVNSHQKLSGEFTQNVDFSFPRQRILRSLESSSGDCRVIDAERLAVDLLGDSIATNMLMLGFAWQSGAVPLTRASLMKAIEMNGVMVEMNHAAFAWGCVAAHDSSYVSSLLPVTKKEGTSDSASLDSVANLISRRESELVRYANRSYGFRYSSLVNSIRVAEERVSPESSNELTRCVAENLYKLMAIKDEYEVGRLFADGSFLARLGEQFDSWDSLEFHLAPPLFAKRDSSGRLKKKRYGSWMIRIFGLLWRMRFLRGTWFDLFGYTSERRMERRLLSDYESILREIARDLNPNNLGSACSLASYPDSVRGFGHVKHSSVESAELERDRLLKNFRSPVVLPEAAE